jgi:DtxR family Mn-dependent transcriptional regulator
MLSTAEQDYVKSIYKLQKIAGEVSTSALAAELGITSASVSGMLRKLSRAKLVTHRQYKGVQLTKHGKRAAMNITRRHRLIELFLVEVLGLSWDKVHREAEILEHAVSDEVLNRIDEVLGFPKHDPHGSPIPEPTGHTAPKMSAFLHQIECGNSGTVAEMTENDPEVLAYLSSIGLVAGAGVRVIQVLGIDGTRILRCGRKVVSISPKVASTIRVLVEV